MFLVASDLSDTHLYVCIYEIEGGCFVEWCDKATKDRHKKTADIRLKRVKQTKQ